MVSKPVIETVKCQARLTGRLDIDSATYSELIHDYDGAYAFRAECPANTITASIGPIAEAISRSSTAGKPRRLLPRSSGHELMDPSQIKLKDYKEFAVYVEMLDVEQQAQMSGKLPSVEEYQRSRMGSIGVGFSLALGEYEPPCTVAVDC